MKPQVRTLLRQPSLPPYGAHPHHESVLGIRYCQRGCWELFLRHRDRIAALPPIRRTENS